jgi:Cu/Zn superoxide dismutase
MKKINKSLVGLAAAVTIALSGFGVHAATDSYSGKVPVLNDLESTSIKKTSSKTTAVNKVTKISSGKLVSWVETSSNGTNMTPQVTYSNTGTITMHFYANGITSRAAMNLNISTSPTTLHTVDTSGTWTPN